MLTGRFLYLRFLIRGANQEKVLNALSKSHVPLRWLNRRTDRALLVACPKEYVPLLLEQCRRFCCRAESVSPPPFSRFVTTICRRKAFLVCAILFVFLLHLSMQHIWQVEIHNAGPYEGDIRAYLAEADIVPGTRKDQISISRLISALEWRYPEAAFVKADFSGTALQIELTLGVPVPDIQTHGSTGDIVASQDGIVHSIITFAGTPVVSAGDFVCKGQVLIRGEERISATQTQPVRARGQVNATLYVERTVTVNNTETMTTPTGSVFTRRVLQTPLGALAVFPSPDYLNYDLYSTSHILGGAWLPIVLIQETYEEIALSSVQRDPALLQNEAAAAAMNLLMKNLQSGDVVVDKWVDYSMIEVESYAARAVAQVLRDIGRFSPHAPASGS